MKKRTRRELDAYVGDYSQVLGIRECTLQGGKAKGIRAFEIKNGQGLEFTVLGDKNMNIPYMTFKGMNMGFVNKTGVCAPEYYQEDGTKGFLRNFEAGFLSTCGLTYMGTPGEENGRKLGLHGPISNTPMLFSCGKMEWDGDTAWMSVTGESREASLFDEYLVLNREFKVSSDVIRMLINARVENRGFSDEPLMFRYHFNFGYPLMSGQTKIYSNMTEIKARDEYSEKYIDQCGVFDEPSVGREEEVFFRTKGSHDIERAEAVIHNEDLNVAVVIHFDPKQLPVLNQWKSQRCGDYALGMEPGTSHVGGRIRARKEGMLMEIEAGEVKNFNIEVEFLDDENLIKKAIKETEV